jgi:hypothetical protein
MDTVPIRSDILLVFAGVAVAVVIVVMFFHPILYEDASIKSGL